MMKWKLTRLSSPPISPSRFSRACRPRGRQSLPAHLLPKAIPDPSSTLQGCEKRVWPLRRWATGLIEPVHGGKSSELGLFGRFGIIPFVLAAPELLVNEPGASGKTSSQRVFVSTASFSEPLITSRRPRNSLSGRWKNSTEGWVFSHPGVQRQGYYKTKRGNVQDASKLSGRTCLFEKETSS